MPKITTTRYRKLPEWAQFEQDVAIFLDGKRQRGSGNSWLYKGDVTSKDFLVECKFTNKDFYTLNIKTWEKIVEEARMVYKIPIIACRAKKVGDFFICNCIDAENFLNNNFIDKICNNIINTERKTFKIISESLIAYTGKITTYNLLCFKIDLNMP